MSLYQLDTPQHSDECMTVVCKCMDCDKEKEFNMTMLDILEGNERYWEIDPCECGINLWMINE